MKLTGFFSFPISSSPPRHDGLHSLKLGWCYSVDREDGLDQRMRSWGQEQHQTGGAAVGRVARLESGSFVCRCASYLVEKLAEHLRKVLLEGFWKRFRSKLEFFVGNWLLRNILHWNRPFMSKKNYPQTCNFYFKVGGNVLPG